MREIDKTKADLVDEVQSLRNQVAELESAAEDHSIAQVALDAQAISHIGHWKLNANTKEISGSDEFFKIFGISREEVSLERLLEVVHPEDRADDIHHITRGMEHGESWDIEHRLLLKDGSLKYVNARGKALRDGAGNIVDLVGTVQDISDKKNAQILAIESANRFRGIINSTQAGYFFIDKEGFFKDVDKAWLAMHGYESREEVIGQHFALTQVDIQLDEAQTIITDLLNGKSIPPGEFSRRCKDGSTGYHSFTVAPVANEGEVIGLEGFLIDTTEQRNTENALKESRATYKSLFEEMLDGFSLHEIICDDKNKPINYRFLAVNPAFERLTGLKGADIVGKTVLEVMPGTEKHWIETYGNVALTGKPAFIENYSKELGKHFEVTAYRPAAGQFVTIFQDVTERKEAQDELALIERKQRAMIENIADVIAILDQEGIIKFKSPNIERHFGWDPNDLTGETGFTTVHPDDLNRIQNEFQNILKTDKSTTTVEYQYLCKDESFKWVELTAKNLIKDPDVNGVLVNYHDISERKKLEKREKKLIEQLARAERMKSLGVLAGGVAHDLNNVLGPMVMLPDIIHEDIQDFIPNGADVEDQVSEALDVIKTSAERASVVVRDLVALSRRGQYDRIPTNINKLSCMNIDSTSITDLRKIHPEVTINYNIATERLIVLGADDHLDRVLNNLIRNAVEAISDKGEVTITTYEKILKKPYSRYAVIAPGDYAVIEVSDTGHGIDPKNLSRIFEPFFTKKKKSERSGSGLGLSVVHGIISDHDGFIDIQSEVEKGTTFSLYLPLIRDATIDTKDDEKEPVIGGTERILIVDDEPGQRYLARITLTKLGYKVSERENGNDALALFEEAHKNNEESPYDLVMLDMIMSDGLDGLETLNEILKLYPKQRVIIASGFAEGSRAQAAEKLGALWLAKPYNKSDLAKVLRKLLDR